MKKLLIDPAKTHVRWAIKSDGAIVKDGEAASFEELGQLQKDETIADVVIDEGYRTHEVREACKKWGWRAVKGPSAEASEIEAACT